MENLSIYFEGTPHMITIGDVTAPCLLNEADDIALAQGGMGQIAAQAVATVASSVFPNLKGNDPAVLVTTQPDNATVTRNYTVWRRLRIMDGALTEILLKAA